MSSQEVFNAQRLRIQDSELNFNENGKCHKNVTKRQSLNSDKKIIFPYDFVCKLSALVVLAGPIHISIKLIYQMHLNSCEWWKEMVLNAKCINSLSSFSKSSLKELQRYHQQKTILHVSCYIRLILQITELGRTPIIKRPIFVVCPHSNRIHCDRELQIASLFCPALLYVILNSEFGELKMEFSSWFVINRRCFVCFCVCVRFYSKFKMLTPELLLNKHWARHFIAFEYLVCVLVFVWWNFGMWRNMKCISTCGDCRATHNIVICLYDNQDIWVHDA